MKLLILGGTRFLGVHLVAAAAARQHELTLFHRGSETLAENPQVEIIHGDRNRDLAKLHGRHWDAVIDTCGYLPRHVAASAEALSAAVEQYVFISSISVYANLSVPGIDETAAVVRLTAGQLQEADTIDASGPVSAATYGPLYGGLKALCEETVQDVMPGRVLSIRSGLIAGPHDYTDRFTYWVARVARGGEVLAPAPPQRSVQFIDAGDLADWIVDMVEHRHCGVFNASGSPSTITMKSLLESCRAVSGSDASWTWVSERFLLDEHVAPWTELPFWLPAAAMPHMGGLMAVNCQKAVAAGLRERSLDQTIGAVLRWYREEQQGRTLRAGLAEDREQQLLQAWRNFV
ncbi:MAG TPA: NAD-dependent epimerase/dehydratase family protein [Thermoanaerobaculia bacterium]|nr:NAD-dependent epimerase/dehydratase family protein [Thermoanaerobaculia bacterium]